MISKNDVVGYENNEGFREVVLEDVLKMFAEKARIELVKLPTKSAHFVRTPKHFSRKMFTKGNKIAIASTTDLEADKIVHALIKNEKLSSAVEDKIIKPLYLFLDKEVLLYAKLRNLKFRKTNIKLDEISKFVNELEKTHPEIKQAVVGSYLGCMNKV